MNDITNKSTMQGTQCRIKVTWIVYQMRLALVQYYTMINGMKPYSTNDLRYTLEFGCDNFE